MPNQVWDRLVPTHFDGGTSCDVNYGAANSSFNSNQAFTIYAHVRQDGDNTGTTTQYIWSKCNSSAQGARFFWNQATASLAFGVNDTGNSAQPSVTTTTNSFQRGQWIDCAANYDGGLLASGITVYQGINGAPIAALGVGTSGNGATAVDSDSADGMHIGERESSTNRAWNGPIALVVRWNRILTREDLRLVQMLGPWVFPDFVFCDANGQDYGPFALRATRTAVRTGVGSPVASGLASYLSFGDIWGYSVPVTTSSGSTRAEARSASTYTVVAQILSPGATRLAARTAASAGRYLELDCSQSAHSSAHPSSSSIVMSGGQPLVTLVPRLTNFEVGNDGQSNVWTQCGAKLHGVNGTTPVIRVDLSHLTSFSMDWSGSDETGWFSYDGITWTRLGLTPTYVGTAGNGGAYVQIGHTSAFTSDTVWINRSQRADSTVVGAWIGDIDTNYPGLLSDLPGGTGWVVDTYSTQNDELGRAIGTKPLYGFQVTDASVQPPVGAKMMACMVSGTHAGEELSTVRMMHFVEFLCSSDPNAIRLRTYFDWVFLPLLNPSGRDGGQVRGGFEFNGNYNDLNRHFHEFPSKFEIVGKPRTVLDAVLPTNMALFMDWHTGAYATDFACQYHLNTTTGYSPLDPQFRDRLIARMSGIAPVQSVAFQSGSEPKMTAGWASAYKSPRLAQTFEHNQSRYVTAANHDDIAEATALVILDLYDAHGFGFAGETKARARTATTYTAIPLGPGTIATTGATRAEGRSASSTLRMQYIVYPVADVAANGWQPSTGADLYAVLDETVLDPADYIYSPSNPTTEQFEVRLGAAIDPLTSGGHTITIGLQAVGLDTNFDFDLVEGSTVLDSWTESVLVTDGAVARSRTLSAAVANSITDYTDLRIRGIARA